VLAGHSGYVGPDRRLTKVTDDGGSLHKFGRSDLRVALDMYARYLVKDKHGNILEQGPPNYVIADIEGLTEYPGFKRIRILKRTPYFVREQDGTVKLITTLGYHQPSESFYVPSGIAKQVSPNLKATQSDAVESLKRLAYIFKDFPLDDVSFSVVIAACLSIPLRMLIDLMPMTLVMAPAQGFGKTLIQSTVAMIVLGGPGNPAQFSENDEEFRKALFSVLLQAPEMVTFDNLTGIFDSKYLAQVLTSTRYADRRLGVSENVDIDVSTFFMGTGNNVVLGEDMRRRTLIARLLSPEEFPTKRKVTEEYLLQYVKDRRADILSSLLTIAQAYFNDDEPAVELAGGPSSDFPEYSLLRSILVYAGAEDPWLARTPSGGLEHSFLGRLLLAMENKQFTSAMMIKLADSPNHAMAAV